MPVTVKIPPQLRTATGGESAPKVEGSTVGEVLDVVELPAAAGYDLLEVRRPDGRTLSIPMGDIQPDASVTATFVVEVGSGAAGPDLLANAVAHASGGIRSNNADALVRMREALLSDRFTIVGRVLEGGCGDPEHQARGAAGVRVFEYHQRMVHTKALLVDDDRALVGSANFDHRSFYLNFEIGVLFLDTGIAAELEALIEGDCGDGCEVKPGRERPPFHHRLWMGFARLLSPMV